MLDYGAVSHHLPLVSSLRALYDEPTIPHFGTETDDEIIERRVYNGRFLFVESLRIGARPRLVLRARSNLCFLSVWMSGRVQSINTSIDDLVVSAARDMTGQMNFVPADSGYEDSIVPIGNLFITNLYLRDQPVPGGLPIRNLAGSLGRRLHIWDAGIWATTEKLAALTRPRAQYSDRYADLLSLALIEELTLLGTHRAEVGSAKVTRGGLAPWQVRNLRDFIEANLVKNITISDLAVLVNLSESHFCRAFRKSFGVPPHRFLLLRRIERAKILLKEPGKSIGEIGACCGFQFPYSLTAAFRRVTGVSPSEYRQSVN